MWDVLVVVRLLRVEDDATVDDRGVLSEDDTSACHCTSQHATTSFHRYFTLLRYYSSSSSWSRVSIISRETASFDRCLIVFFEMGLLPFHVF